MVNPSANDTDQLSANVDCLRAGTLIVSTIPLLRVVFHLCRIVWRQQQQLEVTASFHDTGRDKVIQQKRIKGAESTTRTFDGLVDGFGQGVNTVGIVASGPHVLDVVPRLETLEALSMSIVDVLGSSPY